MPTARTLCLAVGMLLLASCGSGPDMGVATVHIPQGMKRIGIPVAPIFVEPGDHVDVVMIQKGQEIVVLQNVEVLLYDRNEISQQELEALRDLHDKLEALRDVQDKMFEEDLTFLERDNSVDRVDLAVTEEDRIRFVQEVMQRPPGLDLFKPFRLRKL
jgi:hypothetical protein